jgi:hypothetical protein
MSFTPEEQAALEQAAAMPDEPHIPQCPFCGQKSDESQMLLFEPCDFGDSYYVKCDSCGACGPVGAPDEEYDTYDSGACDRAHKSAKESAACLWGEIGLVKGCLYAERDALRVRLEEAEAERDVLVGYLHANYVPHKGYTKDFWRTWAAQEAQKRGDATNV